MAIDIINWLIWWGVRILSLKYVRFAATQTANQNGDMEVSIIAKMKCDALGCHSEKEFECHPCDLEIQVDDSLFPEGRWLVDADENHYCPIHAMDAAKELDLEYAD